MTCNLKLFLSFFILSLSFVNLYTKAATCPPLESIQRKPGTYQWITTEPGWNGYFMSPTKGKGTSYKATRFIGASWVKTQDSANPTGFVQCDYMGDGLFSHEIAANNTDSNQNAQANQNTNTYTRMNNQITQQNSQNNQNNTTAERKVDNEIIRFIQSNANSAASPKLANQPGNWQCAQVETYPNKSCFCLTNIDECSFKLS